MNHFILSAGSAFVCSLLTSIAAFLKRKEGKNYGIFGLYWLSIAFWGFTVAFQFQLLNKVSGFIWGWFLHLGCIFIPVLFFHVAVRLSKRESYLGWVFLAYLIAVIFNLLNAFTPIFTDGVSQRAAYAYPTPALIYPLYFFFFVALIIWGTLLLLASKEPSLAKKGLFAAFLVTHIFAYTGGMDNFLIMWDINLFPLYPYGLYMVTPYALVSLCLLSKREIFA